MSHRAAQRIDVHVLRAAGAVDLRDLLASEVDIGRRAVGPGASRARGPQNLPGLAVDLDACGTIAASDAESPTQPVVGVAPAHAGPAQPVAQVEANALSTLGGQVAPGVERIASGAAIGRDACQLVVCIEVERAGAATHGGRAQVSTVSYL